MSLSLAYPEFRNRIHFFHIFHLFYFLPSLFYLILAFFVIYSRRLGAQYRHIALHVVLAAGSGIEEAKCILVHSEVKREHIICYILLHAQKRFIKNYDKSKT